jgi:hypothetical protein
VIHEPYDFRSQRSQQDAPLLISAPNFPLNVQRVLMPARFSFNIRPVLLRPNKVRKSSPHLPSDNSKPDDGAHKGGDPGINSQMPYRCKKRQCVKCVEEKQDQEHREQRAQPAWEVR